MHESTGFEMTLTGPPPCGHLQGSAPAPRRRLPGAASWLILFVLAVGATQIRSLEQEYFNDESTALVMAGHLLDGNLPYVKLFDNKPPMLFLLLAGALALFGESLLVVRALGDFFLLLSAIVVFAVARRRVSSTAAGLGALLFIAVHVKGPGTATMAALPATAMAMAALWLLLARRHRLWAVAAAGLLLSLATLTRTNLGVLALAFGLWLGIAPLRPSLGVGWRAAPVFALAGLAPLGLLLLVYWRANALESFYLANVLVPLSFSSSMNMAQVLWGLLKYMCSQTLTAPQLFLPFAAAFAAGMVAAVLAAGPSRDRAERELPWLALLATLLAVLVSGAAYLHYWLQLYPICALFCAYGIDWMRSKALLRWAAYLPSAVALAGALAMAVPAAARLATIPGHLSAQHGLKAAALSIDEERGRCDSIYAFAGQLIYWRLGMMPVSAIVHPSNLGNPGIMAPLAEAGRVGADEVGRILGLRPIWLVLWVTPEGRALVPRYFSSRNADLLRHLLDGEYRPFHDGRLGPNRAFRIYKRRDGASPPKVAERCTTTGSQPVAPPMPQRLVYPKAQQPGQGANRAAGGHSLWGLREKRVEN